MESVTAGAVATRAGVSRRTLFNYYPSVESVLTAAITDWVTELSDALLSRPAHEGLLDALTGALEVRPTPEVLHRLETLVRVARTSPGARRFAAEFSTTRVEAFEPVLRARLGPDADPLLVGVAARAVVAAAEAATHEWVQRSTPRGGTDTDPADPADPAEVGDGADAVELHHRLMLEALDVLRRGLADVGRRSPAND